MQKASPDNQATLGSLAESARKTKDGKLPPVHLWNPPFCGDLDMRIARDGTWFYQGTPIGRKALVVLFASIIRKDGDDYFLVTPVEKVGIKVDDAPFIAIDFDVSGAGGSQAITFHTNVDDSVILSRDAPLRMAHNPQTGEPAPYVLVRANLEALIDRKSFYRLVDLGEVMPYQGEDWFGVRSQGQFFPMMRACELTIND